MAKMFFFINAHEALQIARAMKGEITRSLSNICACKSHKHKFRSTLTLMSDNWSAYSLEC